MESKFGWGFYGSPDFVSVMFVYDLAFRLKIRVNRQKNSSIKIQEAGILVFPQHIFAG